MAKKKIEEVSTEEVIEDVTEQVEEVVETIPEDQLPTATIIVDQVEEKRQLLEYHLDRISQSWLEKDAVRAIFESLFR
jgi:hypothetical protein